MQKLIIGMSLLFLISFVSEIKGQSNNRWTFFSGDFKKSQYFIDKTNIQKKKNGNLLVWTKKIDVDRSYSLSKYEVNCSRKAEFLIEYIFYNPIGEITNRGDNEGMGWLVPVPDSVGEKQIITACSYKKNLSKKKKPKLPEIP